MSAPTPYRSRGVYTRTKGEPPGCPHGLGLAQTPSRPGWLDARSGAGGGRAPAGGEGELEAQRLLKPAWPLPLRQQGFPEHWIVEE